MNSLRIVMMAPFGIRPKGTLAARMLPLAQALVARGRQVSIVAPPLQNPEDAGSRVVYGGVPLIHTPRPRLAGPLAVFEQSAALLRAALAEGPGLVHLFKPKGYGGLAVLTLPRGLPLVVDTDDWEGPGGWNDLLPYPATARALFAWQERNLPRRAAAVTVASRTLESLVWALGVPRRRVFYLPNGVRSEQPVARPGQADPYTMLLYTRFWEFDPVELVAALAGIAAGEPRARLMVVGKGENGEEERLLQLAARAGLAGRIDYRGWARPEAIPGLLASAALALVPLNDTLINRARCSAKLLELMAAGLPPVAADVGQSREYLCHEVNGLLVPPHNPGALAGAALRLLGDHELRRRLGAAAARIGERFGWQQLAPLAEQAYDTV